MELFSLLPHTQVTQHLYQLRQGRNHDLGLFEHWDKHSRELIDSTIDLAGTVGETAGASKQLIGTFSKLCGTVIQASGTFIESPDSLIETVCAIKQRTSSIM